MIVDPYKKYYWLCLFRHNILMHFQSSVVCLKNLIFFWILWPFGGYWYILACSRKKSISFMRHSFWTPKMVRFNPHFSSLIPKFVRPVFLFLLTRCTITLITKFKGKNPDDIEYWRRPSHDLEFCLKKNFENWQASALSSAYIQNVMQ